MGLEFLNEGIISWQRVLTISHDVLGFSCTHLHVEGDGGLITFKSFNEGLVTVVLKGSCSGCPSSMITLKAGIEGMMKRMIPEVKEVVAEAE